MTSRDPDDPNIFGANYLENGWRYGLGANGAPIGNGYLTIKWSRDRWRNVTLKGQGRDPNMLMSQYIENGWRYRLGFNGPPIGNGPLRFEWLRDWWRHVIRKCQGHDPNIFFGLVISKTAGDTDLVSLITIEIRMVTWPMTSRDPKKVKIMTPMYLGPIISTTAADTDFVTTDHL